MDYLQALFLGLLQGLTEFFPVSSSAHLKLAKMFFGIQQEHVLFDLSCHFGTLLVLLYFLRKEIFSLSIPKCKELSWAILPLFPFYFLLKPLRDALSHSEYLGLCLMGTSAILFLSSRLRLPIVSPVLRSLWVGTMQATALIPGISRSGATISAGLMAGQDPSSAVRFSFMLAIPTILGGMALELLKFARHPDFTAVDPLACLIGFVTSAAIGYGMFSFAFGLLQRGILKPFAWYCLFLGILVTILLW
ncbi:MAG: undecaprenyl-diphosphate phosphatase [Verrucomicrobia bacterium]|nr:undecaprenyl-diphosphate phosphatase [Verrucomicrobiota bacterium]